jgi:hypothetical protein
MPFAPTSRSTLMRRWSAFRDGVAGPGSGIEQIGDKLFERRLMRGINAAARERANRSFRPGSRAFRVAGFRNSGEQPSDAREATANAFRCAGNDRAGRKCGRSHGTRAFFDRFQNGVRDETRRRKAPTGVADVLGKGAKGDRIQRVAGVETLAEPPMRGAPTFRQLVVQLHRALEKVDGGRDRRGEALVSSAGSARPEGKARANQLFLALVREALADDRSGVRLKRKRDFSQVLSHMSAMFAQGRLTRGEQGHARSFARSGNPSAPY